MSNLFKVLKQPGFWACSMVVVIFVWALVQLSKEPKYIQLGVGDSYELVTGRKIVLLAVELDAKCDFRLISCENNACVVLEEFSLSMKDNDIGPPPDIFISGFKIKLIKLQLKDQIATIEITKI